MPLKSLAFGAALVLSAPAIAQSVSQQSVEATIACMSISDNDERLACLDAAAAQLSGELDASEAAVVESKEQEMRDFGLAAKPAPAEPAQTPVVALQTEDEFGAESVESKRREKENRQLKKIDATITDVAVNRRGKVTLTLDNGQVWRQLSADSTKLFLSGRNKTYTATIKRGLIGSYMLRINEKNKSIRVQRVK